MTDASESAALVLRMKRELMDLVKAAEYASALMACDKLAAVVPRDARAGKAARGKRGAERTSAVATRGATPTKAERPRRAAIVRAT